MSSDSLQAHHDLPWRHKDWLAMEGRGLDVNNPQFGRWVEGTPLGKHQNWSREYESKWRDFISKNPDASAEEVLAYLQKPVATGSYQ